MKKILLGLIPLFLFLVLFVPVRAQMMGGRPAVTQEDQLQTTKDEEEGKAIWDKLQNKEISCKDLTDDDFDVLGDFFMGNMMGVNHASMNKMMTQRLGEEGEKQMHIAMGKRLSGCNTAANFPQGSTYFMPMMGFGGMMGGNWGQQWGNSGFSMMGSGNILGTVTWILIIVFLILGIVYFARGIYKRK